MVVGGMGLSRIYNQLYHFVQYTYSLLESKMEAGLPSTTSPLTTSPQITIKPLEGGADYIGLVHWPVWMFGIPSSPSYRTKPPPSPTASSANLWSRHFWIQKCPLRTVTPLEVSSHLRQTLPWDRFFCDTDQKVMVRLMSKFSVESFLLLKQECITQNWNPAYIQEMCWI